jgi:hypothetical protein
MVAGQAGVDGRKAAGGKVAVVLVDVDQLDPRLRGGLFDRSAQRQRGALVAAADLRVDDQYASQRR